MTRDKTWIAWTNVVLGLWIVATPFVFTGAIGAGAAMWSNVLAGLGVAGLAAYNAYEAQGTTA